jgi:predicted deacylase
VEKQEIITIGGTDIHPGQRVTLDLAAAKLYTHMDIKMPVHVIHGKKYGPCLFVCAAIHGDEILGVEIIRRLLKLKALNRLRGTLIAVPAVNVFGFINHSRYSPDRRDLNRFFPGTEGGSLTSQLANLFMKEIVSQCAYGIDLHSGSNHRENFPQIRAYVDDPEIEQLAYAFGAPIIMAANELEGSLRQASKDMGIKMLLYEAGEVLRFEEVAIRAGIRGIIGVMRAIGMLGAVSVKKTNVHPVISHSSTWVRAPISGIVRTMIRLGDRVTENSTLGIISDPFGEVEEPIVSSAAGIVIGRLNFPLVHKGDALFHVARFDSPSRISSTIEVFRQEFEPEN